MKKINSILMALVAALLVSCSGGGYESNALTFVKTIGELNAEMSVLMKKAMSGEQYDQEAWVAKAEKTMGNLMDMSCYNGEPLSDSNKSAMEKRISNKMYKIQMVSCEVVRSAILRDGEVAFVEIELLKTEGGTKSTIDVVLKSVDGSWKVEVNDWGSEFSKIKKEFEEKMAN